MTTIHPEISREIIRASKILHHNIDTSVACVIAIKPCFADLIYDGNKSIELRKNLPRYKAQLYFIYETAPISLVTGIFVSIQSMSLRLEEFWSTYGLRTGVDKEAFLYYYKKSTHAFGIGINYSSRFQQHFKIATLTGKSTVPQSFFYYKGLSNAQHSMLCDLANSRKV